MISKKTTGLLCLACLLLTLPLAGCSTWTNRSSAKAEADVYNQERALDDDSISNAVRAKIRDTKVFEPYVIEVRTTNGIVYLTGEVDTIEQVELAGELPVTIYGVKHVVNNLIVLD